MNESLKESHSVGKTICPGTGWELSHLHTSTGFPGGPDDKESACTARNPGWIPRLGRPPGEGNGYPLQKSCLENPMDRGAWRATVHGLQRVGHDWASNIFTFSNPANWKFLTLWHCRTIHSLSLKKSHEFQSVYIYKPCHWKVFLLVSFHKREDIKFLYLIEY